MMKTKLAIIALCVAPLTACVAGGEEDWAVETEFDELVEKEPDPIETDVFCVIPPAAHESVTLPFGGDVGGEKSVTSPNGTYYPGYYVTEVTSSGQPNQTAYGENVDLTGTCSANKVETEFFCYSDCWHRCGLNATTSGQLIPGPFGSYCSSSRAIAVPAGVSKVRIKARAWNSATPAVGARVKEGVHWHY
jgi:hypothetical protein